MLKPIQVDLQLPNKFKIVKFWVNIYPHNNSTIHATVANGVCMHPSKEDALTDASPSSKDCVIALPFEITVPITD